MLNAVKRSLTGANPFQGADIELDKFAHWVDDVCHGGLVSPVVRHLAAVICSAMLPLGLEH